ncbi:CAAX amino protease [Paenibacillus montaniterrae]|uniref:CAAX amino protease n=1 Tax=Paenibacillus montaniterrae TaxID=429341 RepID=A0A920CXL3_9BACL|nr:CPBP family intramembrane glutamic endopeptidase [Paenibacillus montaniterrae]GIP15174.1 CAAX amino protease [Paenibacillus montaniterrae]
MKKFKIKFRKIQFRQVSINELDDRVLLLNLYLTQALTLIIGLIWVFFQQQNLFSLLSIPDSIANVFLWGGGLALAAVAVDLLLSRFVPEELSDDGGVNEKIFANRPVWHIALICLVVGFCEELLFRGAVQHAFGPYWTSIIFAVIHVRYLKHWIPTGLVFCISYALGYIYIKTGTIWAPMFAHFLFDFIMGLMIKYRRET